ncbi:protein kinase domain-containing protein [Actinomadura terrae]|uniref:protein kinase domain-containing protein n=1 Tax=Actinomadura terrae TaxID=604353 RepID=UPI001FA78041|nr:tetratricopeptide repeat protein [Actinomadura terrae]
MERAVLAGRYRLDGRLGGGGMGEVWRAFDQVLGRRVAVKVIHAELRDDAGLARQALGRFRREATAAAGLNHRNITMVHDFGEHPYTDRDGRARLLPFLVLELLAGRDLGSMLEEAPAGLPVGEVLDYGIQTCAGLAAAHRAGVVHRDIKPANLMLVPDGTVKICDFGIARLPDVTMGLTSYGVPMGTRGYMPPEQELGRPVDQRADLYALGVTLHHLLTGANGADGPPAVHRTGISEELDDLLSAMVATAPERRPRSADEVAERLQVIVPDAPADRRHVHGLPLRNQSRNGAPANSMRPPVMSPKPRRPWPVPQQLPAPSSVFVGRQDALNVLAGLLPVDGVCEAVVISAIAGGAGIGKTTLAVHWAHQVADRFADGALFVNLRGYDPAEPLHPLQALDGFLRALDVPASKIPDDLHARSALFRTILAGRRVLVVLDNAADADQVRPLLPATPGCLALITSRSHLAGLTTREGAHRVPLDVLPPDQAVHLLRRTIGADRVDAEPEQAHQLARQCGHLPLALRIVADRAAGDPHLRLADLVAELTDERHRLDALATSDDPTTSVRAVFSWSYRLLPKSAARAFRLLGLHAGPDISLQAAAALLDLPTTRARTVLSILTGQHLLQHSGRNRYRFHDLLAVYATERAAQDETPRSCDQAIGRLLTWYLHTAHSTRCLLLPHGRRIPLDEISGNGPPPASFAGGSEALAWLEEERANLVAATRQAFSLGDNVTAWKLAKALSTFLFRRAYADDLRVVSDIGLSASQHLGDKTAHMLMLILRSERLHEQGRHRESIEPAAEALRLGREIDEPDLEAFGNVVIGRAHIALSEFDQAMGCLEQALPIFQAISERRGEGITLTNLGAAHLGLGQLDSAIACSRRAAAILEETQNSDGRAIALRNLGKAYRRQGRYDEAMRQYQKALILLREVGSRRETGITLAELGDFYLAVGQVDRGRQCLQEALTILAPLDYSGVDEIRDLLAANALKPDTTAP